MRTNNSEERGKTTSKFRFRLPSSGLLPLFMLAHFSHHLVTALPIPLLPLIRDDFALNYTRSGFVISAFNLPYGFCQLPAGWLADRIGPRILITIGICGVALAGFLIGFSQTYVMLLTFLALMGVLGGGYHPSSPPLISASVKAKNRGRALGLHLIGGSASYFIVPLIAAVIAATWGWRGSFIILAIPAMVFGIIFYLFLGQWIKTKKTEHSVVGIPKEIPSTQSQWRYLAPFLILTTFHAAVFFSIISFIPLFLVDHFGIAEGTAAALVAVIYSSGLWASVLGGYLSDRLGKVPVVLVVCFIAGPIIYLLNLAPYGLGIGVVLVLIGMLIYIRMPASESYIISHVSERHRSTVLGIYYFGNLEGAGVLTPIMGYLIDQFGFQLSFTIAGAALVAVTVVCAIFLWGRPD